MSSRRKPITYTNYATHNKNKVIYVRYFFNKHFKELFSPFQNTMARQIIHKSLSSYREPNMLLLLYINPLKASQHPFI